MGPRRPTGAEPESDSDEENAANGANAKTSARAGSDLYAADFPISHEIVLGGHTKVCDYELIFSLSSPYIV